MVGVKPKDLKFPYLFEERTPCIQDSIFYIPEFYPSYEEFSFPLWKEIFGNSNPVHIEYCSGNGEWILNKANAYPDINWVAVELKFKRVRKIHAKRINRDVQNLFIVCGKAQVFTSTYLMRNCAEAVYINFPDPWPKSRHAKHRLTQAPFLRSVLQVVKPGGKLKLVSDDLCYVEQTKREFGEIPDWKLRPCGDGGEYGTSYFDRLWRSKGHDIYHLDYRCKKADPS